MSWHPQTPFLTHDGQRVSVDKELYLVLVQLRNLGVKTQYSCQGDVDMSGYILADRKSFGPVLKKIKKLYVKNQLPHAYLQTLVVSFLNGYREREYAIFFGDPERKIGLTFDRGAHNYGGFTIEYSTSWRYGRRIAIRFPNNQIPLLEDLFRHIHERQTQ